MKKVEGKTAIVTGASSGIGRATAQLLAERGANVVVADVNDMGGEETVDLIKQRQGKAIFVKTQVTSRVDIQNLVGATLSTYGGIHILHNNAGVFHVANSIDEVSGDDWRLTIDINLNSLFDISKAVYPVMQGQGGGNIVNTASMAAFGRNSFALAYNAAKHGVLGLTRALSSLGEKDNIIVNCICPSAVGTPLLLDAMPRAGDNIDLMTPDVIAKAVLHLVTHDEMGGVALGIIKRDGVVSYYKAKDVAWDPVDGVV
ncbi:SDR family oxidoreductase [Dehalococcoidia bacterium]|nr:SDR family oxidoreductase [Dehalococcoidia bacterium]